MTATTASPADLHSPRQRLLAHLAMLAFAAMIAGSFTLGALTTPHIGAVPLNAVRFVIGAGLMGLYAFAVLRLPARLPAAPWRFAVLGGLTAFYFVSMFVALTMTAPVATSAVFTLIPLMAAGFGWLFMRQRSGPLVLLSLALAAAGSVFVIFRGDIGAMMRFEIGQGELIYFAGCVAYAVYTPLLKKFSRGEKSAYASFFTLSGCALWICLYGIPDIAATDWLHMPAVVWWAVLYLAIFPTAVSFFCVQFAALRLPAAKVIAYGYLTPVFVILFEGLIGHGWPEAGVLAGALVIVLGLLVLAALPDR